MYRSNGVWKGKKWCLTCAHQHVFELKSSAVEANVAAAAALKLNNEAMEAEEAAKKTAKEAQDDLKLKQENDANAEADLESFLGTMALEKHYSGG